ncbi:MAG TPA: acyl-CoA dehydrogenase family protein [Acidimicrobiia bacterium]|nr:acyl-CoA dehydrogenase family protein [Acidimicrobiia bacterium]
MTYPTHEVINQPPPLEGHNSYTLDQALGEALAREGAAWAGDALEELGALAGSAEAIEWGRLANAHFPVLHTHDRFGHREDRIEFHPAYHSLMETAIAAGLHAAPWVDTRPGAHVARAAKFIVWTSVEPGHLCPMSMTYAVVPALAESPELLAEWLPRLASLFYDPAFLPATRKRGITAGMALTEKQGGSDVRANSTVAQPDGEGAYLLTGHKWFVSGTMADVFLALAQAPGGLTCFFLPRWKPDGSKNNFWIQHIKDKMGDRANATSEVEFADAWALPVGEEGRGVRTIVEMINRTRLDCSLGSAGLMRQGLTQAVHHARHRSAFGRSLDDQSLMLQVLADLALESEAATSAALRLAGAYDRVARGAEAPGFSRIATPVSKYWICKRNPGHSAEALECLGGSGYVEDSGMPRVFRQSPLNGVWEGSGNVICLDVLRAMRREPESLEAFLGELDLAAGTDARYDTALEGLKKALTEVTETGARRLVEDMALLLQASLLLRHSPALVADAFVASRLESPGVAYGALPEGIDAAAIVQRAMPE